jgi:hypothetical protein
VVNQNTDEIKCECTPRVLPWAADGWRKRGRDGGKFYNTNMEWAMNGEINECLHLLGITC